MKTTGARARQAGKKGTRPARRRRDSISREEWQLRCELAACFRLTDMLDMSDLASTHISVRVPGPEHHFLLNPLGVLFDEMKASDLIKVDLEGKLVGKGDESLLNPAGFVIHSSIHMSQPGLLCVMHTHARCLTAVSMQEEGLLPISQKALLMWDFVRYHDFEGAALDMDERERIVRDLGDEGRVVVLRNHGAMTVGRTVAEAFCWMYRMEQSCRYQVDALSGNRKLRELSAHTVQRTAQQGRRILGYGGFLECGKMEWPGLVRRLEREQGTSYRT
ncbi:MAG: class II aldolase/adducin family protein [Betaproteobacteria bacterium]|nr:class II aldolase/adducin family protein [Betaproteobacteria bacterium]